MAEAKLAKDASDDAATTEDLPDVSSPPVKNHLRNAFIALVFAFLTVYALGSYIAWDLDPGDWTADGRLIGAIVSVAGGILMFVGLEKA